MFSESASRFINDSSYVHDASQRAQLYRKIFCSSIRHEFCQIDIRNSNGDRLASSPTVLQEVPFSLKIKLKNPRAVGGGQDLIIYRFSKFYLAAMLLTSIIFYLFVGLVAYAVHLHGAKKNLALKLDLAEASARLGDLATRAAHDIRSPIAALKMISGSIRSSNVTYAEILDKTVNRIHSIAEELLKEAKLQHSQSLSSSLPPQRTFSSDSNSGVSSNPICNLSLAFQEVLEEKILEHPQAKRIVQHHIHQESYVMADEISVKRIISNILNNALEACEGGSSVPEILAEISQSKKRVSLTIKDNGSGIPLEILRQVGSRGFSTKGKQGNGIGLFSSQQLVKKWGGSLVIENRQDTRGTVVRLEFNAFNAPEISNSSL